MTAQLDMAGPLAESLSLTFLFFASCLPSPSTGNMVDKTKVETSEAKANELEKKVKDAEMVSCDAHMNNMSMATYMHTSWCIQFKLEKIMHS